MKVSLVAAIDQNNGIGQDNQMPWHLPADFRHFKALTINQTVLMGRKTAQSLGRALPSRNNWVLSRQAQAPYEGQAVFSSLTQSMEFAKTHGFDELFVIGGGNVYTQSMELATDLYITHVHAALPADTHFPAIDPNIWKSELMFSHPVDEKHEHAFDVYHYTRHVPLY